MRRRKHATSEEEVNLTPLLDIVFIMLIFFIVTASFVNEKGLDINKPDSTSETPPTNDDKSRAIVIEIDGRNVVSIDQRDVDVRAVRANVVRLKAERPKAQVVVRPAANTETEVLVDVMDQAKAAIGNEQVQVSPQR